MNVRRTAQILSPSNLTKSARVWSWYKTHGYNVSFILIAKI